MEGAGSLRVKWWVCFLWNDILVVKIWEVQPKYLNARSVMDLSWYLCAA